MIQAILNKCFIFAAISWLLIDTTAANAQTILARPITTTNWAGYAASNATYSNVSASWVVPTVNCGSPSDGKFSVSFAWVGLGGNNDPIKNTLEQIGTAHSCIGPIPVYGLYYEFAPSTPQIGDASYPLSAGDTVSAKVTRNSDGSYTLSETTTAPGANSPKWTFSITARRQGPATRIRGTTQLKSSWSSQERAVVPRCRSAAVLLYSISPTRKQARRAINGFRSTIQTRSTAIRFTTPRRRWPCFRLPVSWCSSTTSRDASFTALTGGDGQL